jgi:hypothetical protein
LSFHQPNPLLLDDNASPRVPKPIDWSSIIYLIHIVRSPAMSLLTERRPPSLPLHGEWRRFLARNNREQGPTSPWNSRSTNDSQTTWE